MTRAPTTRVCAALVCAALAVLAACEPAPLELVTIEADAVGGGEVGLLFNDVEDGASQDGTCTADDACDFVVRRGDVVTFVARPDARHVFVGWSGDCSGADAVIDVEADDDVDCTGSFAPDPVVLAEAPRLTVDVLGPGAVVSTPAGIDCHGVRADRVACDARFLDGTFVDVRAVADFGATFIGFTGGGCAASFGDTATLLMDGDTSCNATFLEDDVAFPVRVEVEGEGGTITSSPGGIVCGDGGTDCRSTFAAGTFLSLTATPSVGFTFAGWGYACEGIFEESFEFEVQQALACSALFTRAFEVDIAGEGTVTSELTFCSTQFAPCTTSGVPSTLTALPDAGWRLERWTGDCDGDDLTIELAGDERSCTAVFAELPRGLTIDVVGDGRVTAAATDAIDCPDDCFSELATADGGGVLPGPGEWVCPITFFGTDDGCDCGCGVPDPDCGSAAVSACGFCNSGCAVSCDEVAPDQNHLCTTGDTPVVDVTLVATPGPDEEFIGWSGDCFGDTPTLVVEFDDVAQCTATFARRYVVEVTGPGHVDNDDGACFSRCAGLAPHGTLTAVPDATARLVAWEGDCARAVDAGGPLSITVADDVLLCRAVFETIPPSLVVVVDGPGRVSSVGLDCPTTTCRVEGPATGSLSRTLTASADDGAVFAGWSGACAGLSTTAIVTVPLAQSRTCTARFVDAWDFDVVTAHSDVAAGAAWTLAPDGARLTFDALTGANALDRVVVDNGQRLAPLDLDDAGVFGVPLFVTALRDGALLVSLAEDGGRSVHLIDDDGARVATLNAPHAIAVTAAAAGIGADADVVASADANGRIKIWSRQTGLVQRTLAAHTGAVLAVAVDDGLVLSVGADGRVSSRRTTSATVLDEESVGVAVAAALRDRRALVADDAGVLTLLEADVDGLWSVLASVDSGGGAGGDVRGVALSAAGATTDVAVVVVDGVAHRYALPQLTDLGALSASPAGGLRLPGVGPVAIGGDTLVVVDDDGDVELFGADGVLRRALGSEVGDFLTAGGVVGDDEALAVGVEPEALRAVDDVAVTTIADIGGFDVASDGVVAYVANSVDGISVVTLATGAVAPFADDAAGPGALALSPDGALLAVARGGGREGLFVYETSVAELFRSLPDTGDIEDLVFVDDDVLAVVERRGGTGAVRLVRLSTATVLDEEAVALSPRGLAVDGARLAISGVTANGSGAVLVVNAVNPAALSPGPVIALPIAAVGGLTFVAPDAVVVVDVGGGVVAVDVGVGGGVGGGGSVRGAFTTAFDVTDVERWPTAAISGDDLLVVTRSELLRLRLRR